ncbi:dienelactone hydrolase family protein, partial [Salmonella sp. SAL4457]
LLDEAKQIKGRLVLHFAEQDAYCPQQARDAILPCLRNLPKTELYLYPGVDHAFARVGGMHFDKPAYLMAHERSIAALKREIGPNFD